MNALVNPQWLTSDVVLTSGGSQLGNNIVYGNVTTGGYVPQTVTAPATGGVVWYGAVEPYHGIQPQPMVPLVQPFAPPPMSVEGLRELLAAMEGRIVREQQDMDNAPNRKRAISLGGI